MKIKAHILLPIIMLMSVQVIAEENSERGAAKPPAELRLNMSGRSSVSTNTDAQPVPAPIVDKADVYILHPDQVTVQKQPQ